MTTSLFQRGLGVRLAAAVLFGAGAFGAALLLQPRSQAGTALAADAAGPPATALIRIDSIHEVGAWAVRLDGRPLAAGDTSARHWLGEAPLGPQAALVIDAAPAGTEAPPANALRIRIAGTTPARDHTVWCARDWSVAAAVVSLTRSPTPLDPEDLR